MFYHLLYPLHEYFFAFNVFQYITFRSVGALLTALILSFIFGPFLIKRLKQYHIGQHIREDGPAAHLKKAGTPTMGGLLILFTLIISTLLWARLDIRYTFLILIATCWLGFLGFLDDYIKLVKKHSRGLKAIYKLIGQIVLALGIGLYLYINPAGLDTTSRIGVPFFKDILINLGWGYILFVVVVVVGASNAVNLTDGLDGLAIGSIILAAFTYGLIAYLVGHARFSAYLQMITISGSGELSVFLAAMIGAGLGFLWFNAYPAEIFMGDTGSLFLGGTIGIVAVIIKHELLLVIVGGVFVIEALSVIIQVGSFQTRGKRILKMAPLHHHFELKGWAEPKVVIRFWIISVILSLVAFSTLKLR